MADENYASDLNVGRPQLHHLQEIPNKDMLSVTWNNGEQDSFPHIFLRDNCRCPFCYDTVAKQRIFDTVKAADLDIRPKSFWLDDIDSSMHIIWPDGHESMFSSEWLYERRFPKMPADIKPNNFMKPIHWGSELNNDVPSVYFDEVLSDDEVLYSWLETLATYGFCLLKDAPKRSGAIHELSKRFPHIRKTHYG